MMFSNIQKNHYGVILADPPWLFKLYSEKGGNKSPQNHYSCLSLDDIKNLPVSELAKPDCVLVMWATAPMLPMAIETMNSWGFKFKSAGAWAKQSKTGEKWAFGTGYIYRGATEFFILGTRGKPKQKVRNVRNLIVVPVREHSRKPDEMRKNIEALFEGPYLELFAREQAPGWDVWGNETDKFSEAA